MSIEIDELKGESRTMAANKDDLYKLVDQITDPAEIEVAYRALHSIVDHDDQSWFWSDKWQAGEREADEDITCGRVSKAYGDVGELMLDLFDDGGENETDPRQ